MLRAAATTAATDVASRPPGPGDAADAGAASAAGLSASGLSSRTDCACAAGWGAAAPVAIPAEAPPGSPGTSAVSSPSSAAKSAQSGNLVVIYQYRCSMCRCVVGQLRQASCCDAADGVRGVDSMKALMSRALVEHLAPRHVPAGPPVRSRLRRPSPGGLLLPGGERAPEPRLGDPCRWPCCRG